jgi:hypothetical protein
MIGAIAVEPVQNGAASDPRLRGDDQAGTGTRVKQPWIADLKNQGICLLLASRTGIEAFPGLASWVATLPG